jgi:DNA-binding NarL/FixJ family response regulator
MRKKIDVILVTNAPFMESTIKDFLREAGGKEAVTAFSKKELDEFLMNYKADYLLIENIFQMDATYELVGKLARKHPALKIVVFTFKNCERPEICRFFYHGAHSYIDVREHKSSSIEALHKILKGERFFPEWAVELLDDYSENLEAKGGNLTRRETEIMRLIMTGNTCGQIAEILGTAERTIRNHRTRMLEKIGGHGTADIFRHGLSNNIMSVDDILPGKKLMEQEAALTLAPA